jgi:hypothetical protein
MPLPVEHAQHPKLNANKDSAEDLVTFHYLEHIEHIENIADTKSQAPPPPEQRTKSCSLPSAPLNNYIGG